MCHWSHDLFARHVLLLVNYWTIDWLLDLECEPWACLLVWLHKRPWMCYPTPLDPIHIQIHLQNTYIAQIWANIWNIIFLHFIKIWTLLPSLFGPPCNANIQVQFTSVSFTLPFTTILAAVLFYRSSFPLFFCPFSHFLTLSPAKLCMCCYAELTKFISIQGDCNKRYKVVQGTR